MKRKTSIAMILLLTLSLVIPAAAANFSDVSPNDWHYEAVHFAVSSGLFSGTTDTTFSPNAPTTRGMFVTVLGRLADVPDYFGRTQTTPFNDVTQADFFFPYTVWANENGFVTGVGGNSFAPNLEITREQIAAILFRFANYNGYNVLYSDENFATFSDAQSVSEHAIIPLKWATTHGIISGDGGNLRPQNTATRAQVAQMFFNFTNMQMQEIVEENDPSMPN